MEYTSHHGKKKKYTPTPTKKQVEEEEVRELNNRTHRRNPTGPHYTAGQPQRTKEPTNKH